MTSAKKYANARPPRVLRKGNFKGGQPRYPSLPAALWSRVRIGGEDECWPWQASIGSHGYGQFSWGGRLVTAHTMALMVSKGPVPVGMYVLHTCDNRPCCNPKHLYAGTQKQNHQDSVDRGRSKLKVGGGNKLTAAEVENIRRAKAEVAYGKKQHAVLAKQYGVHPDTISSIWSGRTWRIS